MAGDAAQRPPTQRPASHNNLRRKAILHRDIRYAQPHTLRRSKAPARPRYSRLRAKNILKKQRKFAFAVDSA